jgi:hypothetical protein
MKRRRRGDFLSRKRCRMLNNRIAVGTRFTTLRGARSTEIHTIGLPELPQNPHKKTKAIDIPHYLLYLYSMGKLKTTKKKYNI